MKNPGTKLGHRPKFQKFEYTKYAHEGINFTASFLDSTKSGYFIMTSWFRPMHCIENIAFRDVLRRSLIKIYRKLSCCRFILSKFAALLQVRLYIRVSAW